LALAATSSLTQTAWSFAAFTTSVAPDYGASLLPTQSSQAITWNRTTTYTLNLSNTGQLTNTYYLSGTLSTWSFAIEPSSVTLASQVSVTVQAVVMAPLTTIYPASDTLRVTATGIHAAAFSDLITTDGVHQAFLPVILR
jgi:hypothetical protein